MVKMNFSFIILIQALHKLYIHCKQSLNNKPYVEKGGFLVGVKVTKKKTVIFVDSIPAIHADCHPTFMVFKHDDWLFARNYITKKYYYLRTVNIFGWYHSHPGYGVFLSERDRFIVKNFFNKPYNLTLVVDPTKQDFGAFTFNNGYIERIPYSRIELCTKKYDVFSPLNAKLRITYFGSPISMRVKT